MEKKKEINIEETPEETKQPQENREDKILSDMGQEEEGEHNQEELLDDITHDLRTSKTRRG